MAFNIKVALLGDSSNLDRTFRHASNSARGFNKDMQNTSRVSKHTSAGLRQLGGVAALAGGLIGTAGLVSALRGSYREMIQQQQVAAQTAAVLKSTGGVANVSATQVDLLASSLLAKSGIDDEVIKSGENMLLTFRGIRNEAGKGNDIFNQATQAILDMDTAMSHGNVTQESLSKSAIRVGKALQDPIKGATALRRVGVQFTKEQQVQIKELVESGKTMQAQKLILRELNTEFGGSARALGTTLPGKINIFRESLRNLGGQMATVLLPALTKVIDRLNRWISNTRNQQRVMNAFKQVVAAVSGVIRIASSVMRGLNRISGSTKHTIELLIGALIVLKTFKLGFGLANAIGLIGTRAKTARGETLLLRKSLLGALRLGAKVALAAKVAKVAGPIGVAAAVASLPNAAGGKTSEVTSPFGKSILNQIKNRQFSADEFKRALKIAGIKDGTTVGQALNDPKFVKALRSVIAADARRTTGDLNRLGPHEQLTVNTHVNLDGKVIAKNTTHHQRKNRRHRSESRRGPYAGRH